jgi:microcystin-dependent protein
MSDPFIGEIKIFAGSFAPRGWAFCNGQLLQIAQHTALFSIVGTTYGGDGRTTFGLPNLQGRAPMHAGRGPGLTPRRLGQTGGAATVTLTMQQLPNHTHALRASLNPAEAPGPNGNALARSVGLAAYQTDTTNNLVEMADASLPSMGGGQAHDNMQPFLTMHFIIALTGIFPSRS